MKITQVTHRTPVSSWSPLPLDYSTYTQNNSKITQRNKSTCGVQCDLYSTLGITNEAAPRSTRPNANVLGVDAGGHSLLQWGSGVLPLKKCNFYTKPCILGNICAIIGPQNGPILL